MATIQDLGKVAYFNKGAYNSETNYEINDVVSYNGSSYVSLVNNNRGNLPTNTNFWSVVASKGDKGDTGKPFVIEKTYESIEDMVTDYDNMNVNDYVMISGDIEEQQNATLWTKTDTEVSPYKWVYLADFSGASGITGATPNIQIGNVTEGNEPSVTRRAGSTNENPILDFVLKTGATGATGATGNGISSVTKTATSGLTDTYTIAYTNGNNTTFNVNNGKGIASIAKTSTSGLVDTYTITYNDGTTSTFQITNGEDGEVTQAQLDETNREVNKYKSIYNVLPKVKNDTLSSEVELDGTGEAYMKLKPIGKVSQKPLPSEYTAVDYIESHGQEFINTNVPMSDIVKIEGKFAFTSTSVVQGFFGEYTSNNTTLQSILNSNTNLISFKWLSQLVSIDADTNKHSFAISNKEAIIDGVVKSTYDLGKSSDNKFLVLMCRRASEGGVQDCAFMRIYYFNIYDDNGQIREFIPCYRNSDNEVGMYDLINDVFYTNQGIGSFTYGSAITMPDPDHPQPIKVVTGDNNVKVQNKNLFDKDNAIVLNAYIGDNHIIDNDNNKITLYKCKPNTTYTISKHVGTRFKVALCSSTTTPTINTITGTEIQDNTASSITITSEDYTTYLVIWYYISTDSVSATEMLNSLQIEQSPTPTSYTPHKEQNYELNLGVRNLCDGIMSQGTLNANGTISASTIRITTENYISVSPNTKYTISIANGYIAMQGYEYTQDKSGINYILTTNNGTNSFSFTTKNNTHYIKIIVKNNNDTDITPSETIKIQLEEGSIAHPYTPYGVEPLEMYDGDYFFKNEIDSEDYDSNLDLNAWYLKNNYRKLELAIADMNNSEDYPGWRNVPYINEDYPGAGAINEYVGSNWKSNISKSSWFINKNVNVLYFATSIKQSQWKERYPNLIFVLFYLLPTPTFTKVTNTTLISQLETLNSANSYQEKTYITCTSASTDNELLQVKATALRDLNNILDQTQGE